MTAPLIGIGGRLRAGKDTVADYLVEKHGFVKMGMADALHEQMLTLNPAVDTDPEYNFVTYADVIAIHGYTEAKARFREVRRLLQSFGDVLKDLYGPDALMLLAHRRAESLLAEGKSVVLSGLRFPNEVEMVRHLGGSSWWVERPVPLVSKLTPHISERSVTAADFDDVLVNSGTLERLYAVTEVALKTARA